MKPPNHQLAPLFPPYQLRQTNTASLGLCPQQRRATVRLVQQVQ